MAQKEEKKPAETKPKPAEAKPKLVEKMKAKLKITKKEAKPAEPKPEPAKKEEKAPEPKPAEARPTEKKEEKPKPAEKKEEKAKPAKKEEAKIVSEAVHLINLGPAYKKPWSKRAGKAIKLIKAYVMKHLRKPAKIEPSLNEQIWQYGRERPERRIKVRLQEQENFVKVGPVS